MKTLIRLLGVFVLVAIFLFPNSALVSGSEDWVVYMSVTTDPNVGSVPGGGSNFGFGARDGAGDGYNSGEGDEIAPPDPMAGINAYFYYPANPPFQKNLITSVTGPAASITWPLVVKMVGETGDAEMTISWPDISSVPASYIVLELQDTGGTTLADMRSVDQYTFSASQGQTYNYQIRAEVEEMLEYDLTIDSTDGGEVTTPGEGVFTYDEGTVVDLVATPGAGYRFDEWSGDVGTVADVNAASTDITMNGDYSITVNFVAIYDLTTSSTAGGSVTTPGEETFTYDEGTVIDLVATPEAGYLFDEWTGDVDTIANVNAATTTIIMTGDYEITANFEQIPPGQFALTVSSTSGGSVTVPGEATFTYGEGTVVDLVAEADEGYRFVEWTGDVDTIGDVDAASTTITMDSSYSIRANFNVPGPLCFIATAAYGTPMAQEIETLREFRDVYLLTNPLGQAFVDFYYRVSPPMAEFITEHPSLKPIVRAGLLPAVVMSTLVVNTTPAEKMAILGLLVLVSVALAVWATRRRHRGPEYS